jgi:hypothetical protein
MITNKKNCPRCLLSMKMGLSVILKSPQYFLSFHSHSYLIHQLTHKNLDFLLSALKMNSKILQDKIKDIEDEEIEMRLLKRSEKNQENGEDKERVIISSSQSTVSMKHYDQVKGIFLEI